MKSYHFIDEIYIKEKAAGITEESRITQYMETVFLKNPFYGSIISEKEIAAIFDVVENQEYYKNTIGSEMIKNYELLSEAFVICYKKGVKQGLLLLQDLILRMDQHMEISTYHGLLGSRFFMNHKDEELFLYAMFYGYRAKAYMALEDFPHALEDFNFACNIHDWLRQNEKLKGEALWDAIILDYGFIVASYKCYQDTLNKEFLAKMNVTLTNVIQLLRSFHSGEKDIYILERMHGIKAHVCSLLTLSEESLQHLKIAYMKTKNNWALDPDQKEELLIILSAYYNYEKLFDDMMKKTFLEKLKNERPITLTIEELPKSTFICSPDISDISSIAGGDHFIAALKKDGTIACVDRNTSRNILGFSQMKKIIAKGEHLFAIQKDGKIKYSGMDLLFEKQLSQWSGIADIACEKDTVLALKENGTVTAYKSAQEDSGQFGHLHQWQDITAIACFHHLVGLKKDGKVLACGPNNSGQCDVSMWEGIKEIHAGNGFTLGLTNEGKVLASGINNLGQCNAMQWQNIKKIQVSDSLVAGLTIGGDVLFCGYARGKDTQTHTWKNIQDIYVFSDRIAGITQDGSLIYTGDNLKGDDMDEFTNIAQIVMGESFLTVLKKDGRIASLGNIPKMQLPLSEKEIRMIADGENSTIYLHQDGNVKICKRSEFSNMERSVTWEDIVQISMSEYHGVALKKNGDLVAMGNNAHGECNVASFHHIVKAVAGNAHTVCLKNDGTLQATGSNELGQCNVGRWTEVCSINVRPNATIGLLQNGKIRYTGDGLMEEFKTMDQWENIVEIASTENMTMGLSRSGSVYVCSSFSQNNTAFFTQWNNIKKIVAGHHHFYALTKDGKLLTTDRKDPAIFKWKNIEDIGASGHYFYAYIGTEHQNRKKERKGLLKKLKNFISTLA